MDVTIFCFPSSPPPGRGRGRGGERRGLKISYEGEATRKAEEVCGVLVW